MDFVFASTLQNFMMLLLRVISYDIACQWFVNLYECMNGWPSNLRINGPLKLQPVIPKFHEPAHKVEKHHKFSCNLVKGLGNCDCEGPECIWGGHNNLGNSMKMMGPGSRHDVLNDHFGFWNWQKYVGIGKSLICKYKAATEERNMQVEEHRGLSANLLTHLVAQWDLLCEVWEDDTFPKTVENPFHVDREFLSEKEVEKELEEEERKRNGGVVHHAMSADKFLVLGLELEESQQKVQSVAVKCTNKTLTKHQDMSLADQRNVLCTKLKAWEPFPEDIKLWLPSSISADHWVSICIEGLLGIEDRLWTAQCNNALQGIRHTLCLKLRMVQFKNKNTRGQQAMTRSHSVIDGVHQWALAFATRYRTAWTAKQELIGGSEWKQMLRVLDNKNIRAYTDPEHVVCGTGRQGMNEDSDEPQRHEDVVPQEVDVEVDKNDKILQSEWCRSRACAKWSQEEVLLLKEKMWRVLQFLKWKAYWWDERWSIQNTGQDIVFAESLNAYACWQCNLQLLLRQSFQDIWMTPLEDMQKEAEAATLEKSGADDEDGNNEEEDESDFEEVDGEGSDVDGSDDEDTRDIN
ncbi:uncharacterized protein ARMOST_11710 [Armillaria ostoyae]|uniref:Ubiquitin-like protease family profile domain-containing protein n=1 Tax=Armillaria ostoyae TaxID=47428 RepID=A0A284RI03_ARMOS|nr:uncharacterized protein ARMOST_11710 [Armillaria ostoyae]